MSETLATVVPTLPLREVAQHDRGDFLTRRPASHAIRNRQSHQPRAAVWVSIHNQVMDSSLTRPASSLGASAEKFGPRISTHLANFRTCMKLASEVAENRSDPGPLQSQIGLLDDALDAVPQTDVLFHHINALCSAAAAFGCVTNEQPLQHLDAIVDDTTPSIHALRNMSDTSHSQFAEDVSSVFSAIREWFTRNTSTPTASAASVSTSSDLPSSLSSSEKSPSSTHTAPHLLDYTSKIMQAPVTTFKSAAHSLGGGVAQVASPAADAFAEVYNFLVQASQLPGPPADEEKQAMIKNVVAHMTTVADISAKCKSGDKYFNHIKAVEEAMNMLSWIAAVEKPVTFISDADGSASFYLNKVLTTTKKDPDAASHKAFVDALKAIFPAMKEYVREYHTMGVRYGLGIHASQSAPSDAISPVSQQDDEGDEGDYIVKYKQILQGPLSAYVTASKALGGEVAEQAILFEAVWKAEAEFLERAISSPKPDPEKMQTMLAPVAEKMQLVAGVVDKLDPRSSFAHHCSAVSESVGALGWIAVDEKATAFVGDMSGAGQFYIDKVKMGAKKADNPEHHRTWASALELLFSDLKAYVKEHHTQQLVWNPPKRKTLSKKSVFASSQGGSAAQADYVSLFRDIITGPLAAFVEASRHLGGDVEKQAESFAKAWEAEAQFLAQAIKTPKPNDVQGMIEPIATEMGKVAEIGESVDPRGPFANHCSSVSESVGALGWVVVDEKATAFVADMAGAGQFFVDKVKMGAKKTNDPEAHRTWAKSLEEVYAMLKSYVKEHHTQKLTWNPPKMNTASGQASALPSEGVGAGTDYVAAFQAIIDGQLKVFLSASDKLGGEVKEQSIALADAWKAEKEFLSKAITMSKPNSIDEMVAPIGSKMALVAAAAEKADPRGPYAQHCTAVAESIGALGWVVVDEKATIFVADTAGAGQFFIDKVKIDAKKTTNPSAHREWAQALEALLAGLKAYVKTHHTQTLTWKAV